MWRHFSKILSRKLSARDLHMQPLDAREPILLHVAPPYKSTLEYSFADSPGGLGYSERKRSLNT